MTLIFTSAETALRAKKLLAEHYIDCSPTLSPAATAFSGGGHAMKLSDEALLPQALTALKMRLLVPSGILKEP